MLLFLSEIHEEVPGLKTEIFTEDLAEEVS